MQEGRGASSTPFLLSNTYTIRSNVQYYVTVHVEHVYDEQFPTSAVRDYDNLQLKKVLDMITLFTMTDDTGRLCNLYQTTRLDKFACTRIYVMAKDRFVDWLKSKPQGQK